MRKEEKISYLEKVTNSIYFSKKITNSFFEKWYYRNIFLQQDFAISIVPGIYSSNYEEFAFIQVRHSKMGTFTFKYQIREVECSKDPFCIRIGDSYFYKDHIDIDIDENELVLKGTLKFEKIKSIKETKFAPNIMGPLAYLNNLDNNHAIISMHHKIKGNLEIDGTEFNDLEGTGYIEKNWGTNFLDKYIKATCNTFEDSTASLFMEISKINLGIIKVINYDCVFIINNDEYRFATYNLSKVDSKNSYNERYLFTFKNSKNILEAQIYLGNDNIVYNKDSNEIPRNIIEKLDSGIKVKLYDKNGKLLFKDNSNYAGVEIVK